MKKPKSLKQQLALDDRIYADAQKLVRKYTRHGRRDLDGWPPSLDEATRIAIIFNALLVPALRSGGARKTKSTPKSTCF